jgi:type II secretory pathway predicted ATPase ExeA/septal ring-binding cell division protein DamX
MYYSHFGLNQAPFKITPNTEFFFAGGNRGPVLEALVYAITHGEGIVKVTGEVGSGKTMLCHMLQARLPAHIESVYIANPSVTPEEILRAIAFELQISAARDAPRLEVMQLIQEFLLKRYATGKRVVVFVEESQSMPLATLEEIRLLSNLETRNDKLMQIVLFGQPELDENLRQSNIRQLRERITHSFRLEPLNPAEIHEYLMFRMRAAGYRGPDMFSPAVVKQIASASQGLSRRVNLIADKALLVAFSENTHTIRPKHVEAAVRDSEFSQRPPRHAELRYAWGAGLVAAGALAGVGAYMLFERNTYPRAMPAAEISPYTEKEILKAIAPAPPARPEIPKEPTPTASLATPAAKASAATGPTTAAAPVSPPTAALAAAPTTSPAAVPAAPTAAPAKSDTPPAAPAETRGEAAATRQLENALEARITATRQWLASEPPGTYSIQLLGSEDSEQLKRHLKVISKSVEINKIFVYRTVARQKPSLTVLYGSFNDHGAAKEALQTLPASLRAFKPILRTVQGIQGEIKRHESAERQQGNANS